MITDVATIGIAIQTEGIERGKRSLDDLANAGPKVEKSLKGVETAAGSAGRGIKTFGEDTARVGEAGNQAARGLGIAASAMSQLRAAAASYIGLQTAQAFVRTADAVTVLNNQLRLATGSAAAAEVAYGRLYRVAQDARVSFTELSATYSSIARATGELGVSQQRMLTVTQSIANAMAISGGSAQGMQAALVQLSQGMASGTLRGEELNSVLEQAPRLAKAIADGMGVTIGKLRELGAAGQLTSEAVIKALESQSDVLRKEVAGATLTVSQAFTQLSNASTNAVGEFDKASGSSAALARGLSATASAMDSLGRAFKENEKPILGVMGALTGAAALASLAAVPRAIAAITGAVTALSVVLAANPVVLGLLGLGAVVGGAAALSSGFKQTEEGIRKTIASLEALNKQGPSIYARDDEGMRQWDATVVKRKKQIAELQQQLALMNSSGLGTRAEDARFAAQTEQMRSQQRAADELAAVKQKLSGVDKDYLPTLNKLYAAYQSGSLSLKEYQDLVGKLAEANFKADKGAAASAKDAIDARLQAIKSGIATEAALTKASLEDLASMRRMQQVSERDYIDQTANLEVAQLEKKRASLQQEMTLQASQKDSLQEVAAIKGQMDVVDQEISERRKKQLREINELTWKQREAIQAVLLAQKQQDEEDWTSYDRQRQQAYTAALIAAREYGRQVDLANEAVGYELSLMGKGQRERAIAIEQYKIQVKLKERLLAIEGKTTDAAEREALRAIEEANAAREMAGVQQRVMVEEWQRTTDQVDDIFRAGFADMLNNGESAWGSFTKSLATTFKTAVANEIYKTFAQKYVLQVASGTLEVLGLGGGGSGGGGGGLLGAASTAKDAYSLYSAATGYSSGVASIAGLLGAGQVAGSSAAALGYANAVGAIGGDALGALIAGNAAWGGVATTGAAAGAAAGASAGAAAGTAAGTAAAGAGAGAGTGAAGTAAGMGPYGWVAAAVILAVMAFAGKGEKRYGGQYGINFEGDEVTNGRRGTTVSAERGSIAFLEGPSGGDYAGDVARKLITGTTQGINTLLKDLGSGMALTGFQAGLETSGKSRGGVYSGGTLTGGVTFGESGKGDNYKGTLFEKTSSRSPNAEEAVKNFATDMLQVTIQALQAATDLPKSIAAQLKGIDAEKLTDEAASELLNSISQQIEFVKGLRTAIDALPFPNLRNLSFDAAAGLLAAAGGLEQFNQSLSGYLENYFTEEEQRKVAVDQTAAAFKALGLTMPSLEQASDAARKQFRALVESININTEEGQKQYTGLLALQSAFAELTPIIDNTAEVAQAAAAALQQRQSLELQLLQLQGNTDEIRKRQLADLLSDENRLIQQAIFDLQDKQAADTAAKAAQDAAERVRDAWKSVGDTLVDEVKRIRGEIAGSGAIGLAEAQAQFAIATGQARAGDQEAASSLPELSRTVLELAQQTASSAADLKIFQSKIAASLAETTRAIAESQGFAVPAFASGGSHSGGWALVGEGGPELAYMPPAQIYPAGQTAGAFGEMAAMSDEIRQLREDWRIANAALAGQLLRVARATEKGANLLDEVTDGGTGMRNQGATP